MHGAAMPCAFNKKIRVTKRETLTMYNLFIMLKMNRHRKKKVCKNSISFIIAVCIKTQTSCYILNGVNSRISDMPNDSGTLFLLHRVHWVYLLHDWVG